jgi:hypothetical protein
MVEMGAFSVDGLIERGHQVAFVTPAPSPASHKGDDRGQFRVAGEDT